MRRYGYMSDDIDSDKRVARVLLIEDDPVFRELCSRFLTADLKYNFQVSAVETAHEALLECETVAFDCLIVDYRLPGHTGTEILSMLKDRLGEHLAPTIVMTSEGGEQAAVDAIRAGAQDFLFKRTLTRDALRRTVSNAVERGRLKRSISAGRKELKASCELLSRRNEEITRFYHNLSHEMKTPLTAVREYVSIVNDGLAGTVVDEQRKLLGHALAGCDQLATQFNDLLDLARLETGKVSVELETSTIANVFERCQLGARAAIQAKGVEVDCDIAPGIETLLMDENRIVQVVGNFLDNAIKFTPGGGHITLKAETLSEKSRVRISVSDNGIGIDSEQHAQIFERLFQVSSSNLQETPCGMGIGLAIASEIVKAHGSKIHVASELGKGAEFSFELDACEARQQAA